MAAVKRLAMLIFVMATNLVCFSTRTFRTNTRHSYSKVIAANARDATYVLDGLLYHESDLRIEEHYTDTVGFTDHVFALCHLLGFRFAPRIRDLADKRLYVSDPDREYGTLAPLVGGRLHLKLITAQWEEVLRLAASDSSWHRHGFANYPQVGQLSAPK